MVLENIVPWGRLKKEYIKMFNLTENDLELKILGCGDGPSSFNSECPGNITSLDPIYRYSKSDIRDRIDKTSDIICSELEKSKDDFIWTEFKDVNDLKKSRLRAMHMFLEDYDKGKQEQRYIEGSLPELDFSDNSFDLILCSHFLFLYSKQLNFEFHINSIKEMLRVGNTIRIFPICDLKGNKSIHLKEILKWLEKNNFIHKLCRTGYEFQKGANQYLEIINNN